MFGLSIARRAGKGLTALAFETNGFALAHVVQREGTRPELQVCEYVEVPAADVETELLRAVRRHRLERTPTVVVPDPRAYSLCQFEPPAVAPEELPDAARWSIQELVDFDVADAVVDAFEFEGSDERGRQRQACAVAMPVGAVRTLVERARACRLQTVAIDIAEMSLRNLASRIRGADKGVAFVFLRGGCGRITITRGASLYLIRQLELDTEPLELRGDSVGPALEGELEQAASGMIERLVLELQRSLDFYEHLLGQDPVGSIALGATEAGLSDLVAVLGKNLPVGVDRYEVNNLFTCREPLPDVVQARCLVAIGAALREGVRA